MCTWREGACSWPPRGVAPALPLCAAAPSAPLALGSDWSCPPLGRPARPYASHSRLQLALLAWQSSSRPWSGRWVGLFPRSVLAAALPAMFSASLSSVPLPVPATPLRSVPAPSSLSTVDKLLPPHLFPHPASLQGQGQQGFSRAPFGWGGVGVRLLGVLSPRPVACQVFHPSTVRGSHPGLRRPFLLLLLLSGEDCSVFALPPPRPPPYCMSAAAPALAAV